MTRFLIPAALALSVFAVSGTSLISPIQTADAATNCKKGATRTTCETHKRRALQTTPRGHNYVGGGDYALQADPGGGGGRR